MEASQYRVKVAYNLAEEEDEAELARISKKSLGMINAILDTGDVAACAPYLKIVLARVSKVLTDETVDKFDELREMMGGLVQTAQKMTGTDNIVEFPEIDTDEE